jgi:5-methylthioadenosine/S-adenosylhomocysteine deaminase
MATCAWGSSGTTLIQGGMVVPDARSPARTCDVLVRAGVIEALLTPGQLKPSPDMAVIDARGNLLIPGLINAHTHSHFTFGKGRNLGWNLELHQHLTPGLSGQQTISDLALHARVAAAEMISNGCTSCYDMVVQLPVPTPEGMLAVAEAYAAVGLRARIALNIADQTVWSGLPGLRDALPPDGQALVDSFQQQGASANELLSAAAEVINCWQTSAPAGISLALAPSNPLLCSEALFKGAVQLAQRHGIELHTHLAESKIQAEAGLRRFGKTLTRYLADLGCLNASLTAAHAVWVNQDDLELMARHGVKVAHNPTSNLRLGNGVASVRNMLDLGLCLGIGTDACTCSDQLNMFESVRQAALVSRLMSNDSEKWLSAADALELATTQAARVIGEPTLGKIAPGYGADIVFLDRSHLNYVPLNDAVTQVVFNENGGAVRSVMVGGTLVFEGGRFTRIDVSALAYEANERNAERRAQLADKERVLGGFAGSVRGFSAAYSDRQQH